MGLFLHLVHGLASCLRHDLKADLCPLPAGNLRLCPLSPWTALPPRKASPHAPPVCAKLDMEPRALCWLQHTLSTEPHALPTLSLFKPKRSRHFVFILQTYKVPSR